MTINNYFDKIYLLNLKKREDRLEDSISRLSKLDINFDIFNGVDGSVMNHIWKKLENGNFTNPNYVGCCLSHLSIYKHAIENSYERILIIEDDCMINKNINNIFDSLLIPEWSDLMYLGYIPLNDDCSMWDYKFGINQSNVLSDKFFNPKNLWGLYSYGISINLMKELVDIYNDSFPMELDRYFVNFIQKRDKSIAISPQIFCCKDDIFSDNLGYNQTNMKLKSDNTRYEILYNYI